MKKNYVLYLFLLIGINIITAQTLKPIARLVDNAKTQQVDFKDVQGIIQSTTTSRSLAEIRDASKVTFFDYNVNYFQREFVQNTSKSISLNISINSAESYNLDLVEVPETFYEYGVRTNSAQLRTSDETAKHYRGIVRGLETESLVSISFFNNQMIGVISINGIGNINIGKLRNSDLHVVYADTNVNSLPDYECETPDDDQFGLPYTAEQLFQSNSNRSEGKCIKLYFETEVDIFTALGSVTAVENYVTGVFNNVATLYQNDGVTTEISEINVWNSTDPYTATNTGALLSEFQANTGAFNGDLGQLLTFRNVGGGRAAGFDGLCNPNSDLSLSVSGNMSANYPDVPAYSFTVHVVTHEFGHLFGSRHTHACVWNGNNTAIDGCAGFTEGGCPLPGIPAGGGTIMSYCHIQSVGIDFNLGFGPQPGNVIRNNVDNAQCIESCCPYIEMVRLWDDSYQNPSGDGDYTDYTDNCIPIFETDQQQINIEPSEDGVYIALFIDLNGDGDFCDAGEEYFNAFVANNGVGVNLTSAIANGDIVGGEIVRTVVSDSPISCDSIPECGEVEDYRLCPPCDGPAEGCIDFNCEQHTPLMGTSCDAICHPNLLDGWGGFNIDGVAYRNDDSIGGVDDFYLFIDDGPCSNGGSFVFNHDDFAGDWTDRGNCICFDLNAFHVGSTISGSSSLRIGNGVDNCSSNITATFVLDSPISVADGWVNICAPVELSESGALPGNDVGHWEINTGSAADWDALIQNVQSLIFYVDVDSGNEQWGLDNICFDECVDCDEFNDASFTVQQKCSEDGVEISVEDFELYTDLGATHEWYIVSSPNQGAGPYTPVTSTTTTGAGPHVLATDLPIELYYTVFHKVITEDCGELCFAWEVWCNRGQNNKTRAEVDCCLIFEHWPNGPGEPMDFTAEFNHEITLANIINAEPVNDYSGNPNIVHEWYLYSREELNSGDFTFITMQTGVNFSWGTAQEGIYYFLLHKVISDCGEVCYIRAIYKSRSSDSQTREECEICGPIDCSFIDDPNPKDCETSAPINLELNGATLTWDPVPGATGYIVESTNFWPSTCSCDNPVSILPIETTETTVDLPISPGRCFVIQVRAICEDGSLSEPSDWICVGGRGGHDEKVFEKASITPNPTNGQMTINVETTYDTLVTIEIYDIYGNVIKSFETEVSHESGYSLFWDGNGLEVGVYFVKFKTNLETLYQRVIVH